MSDWFRHAAAAAVLAGEHPAWWVAGALGFFVYLGWLPLALTVVPAPNAGDLAYLGVQLVSSTLFPLNVLILAVALAGSVLLACLVAGFAEVLLVGLARTGAPQAGRTLPALGEILLATLPALAVAVVIVQRVSAIAPDRFLSTASLAEILGSLARELWPLLALLALAALAGQALGAVALRVRGRGATLRELARHPLRHGATAVVAALVELVTVVFSLALLRVLWAPIAADLAAGRFLSPSTLVLLVGFVAIWLALLLAAGAVRTWLSAWWSLEVSPQP